MRIDLCFQSLQFGILLSFHQFCFFYLCFNKVSKKPKCRTDEDRCTAVKNIIKVIINKLGSLRIISNPEKSRQKPFFHKITNTNKATCAQEKHNNRFINFIAVKKLRDNHKIIHIETSDTGDKKSNIKDRILRIKNKIRNNNCSGYINCPKENVQIKEFIDFHTTKINFPGFFLPVYRQMIHFIR